MVWRVVLTLATMIPLFAQTSGPADASFRRLERTLKSVIQWEILWRSTPTGFRTPISGTANVSISIAEKDLSYCSHDLGVCATYLTEGSRNWERLKSKKCEGKENDEDALLAFLEAGGKKIPNRARDQQPTMLGPDGFSGAWTVATPIRWGTTIKLDPRSAIVRQYRQVHPPEAESLLNWLRTTLHDSGYLSVTIACFNPSDPVVHVYGERATKDPIVFSLFWDRDREEWIQAGMLERQQGQQTFDELKSTIRTIACGTIQFK